MKSISGSISYDCFVCFFLYRAFKGTLQTIALHSMKNDELRNPFYLNLSNASHKIPSFLSQARFGSFVCCKLSTKPPSFKWPLQRSTHTNHLIEIYDVSFIRCLSGHMQFLWNTSHTHIWSNSSRSNQVLQRWSCWNAITCFSTYRHFILFFSQYKLVWQRNILIYYFFGSNLSCNLTLNPFGSHKRIGLYSHFVRLVSRKHWTLFINFNLNHVYVCVFRDLPSIIINYDKTKPVFPFL